VGRGKTVGHEEIPYRVSPFAAELQVQLVWTAVVAVAFDRDDQLPIVGGELFESRTCTSHAIRDERQGGS
jgi:hypothetical protein